MESESKRSKITSKADPSDEQGDHEGGRERGGASRQKVVSSEQAQGKGKSGLYRKGVGAKSGGGVATPTSGLDMAYDMVFEQVFLPKSQRAPVRSIISMN